MNGRVAAAVILIAAGIAVLAAAYLVIRGYARARRERASWRWQARHDPLTGLANRQLLSEQATVALTEADRDGTRVGLLLIDLDHFKEINDTLGHGAGDEMLRTVAGRLARAVPPSDLVARLGGDEFAVLACAMPNAARALTVAGKLLPLIAEPADHEGLRLVVEGSIGVAVYPDDAATVEHLLSRADLALYRAKRSRGAVARYKSEQEASDRDRTALATEVRAGIDSHEFVLHFQPQVELATGQVVRAEVLARWQHPRHGLLGPHEVLGAVEHSGLMREFTLHVLDRAVVACAGWRRDGASAAVSVNLAAQRP